MLLIPGEKNDIYDQFSDSAERITCVLYCVNENNYHSGTENRDGSRISQRGYQPQKLETSTYHVTKFSRKLHENIETIGPRGERASTVCLCKIRHWKSIEN